MTPIACTLVGLHWPSVFGAWVLDREGVRAGELWRLWSGHLVHVGARHAVLDLTAMALLLAIAANMRGLRSLLAMNLLLMPGISIGLLWLLPELQWYAGLSGVLHGWVAWLLLRRGGAMAAIGLLLLALKLYWEMGRVAFIGDVMVVTEAHRLGSIVAIGLAFAWRWIATNHSEYRTVNPSTARL